MRFAGLAGLLVPALALLGLPAHADKAAADACAAGLNADGKAIYAASISAVAAGGDVRSVVGDKARALVMDGKVSRANARPAAEAAGQCLVRAGG
ncbi:hypothetical protein KHC19_17010 [Ancylobacter oerskovii]|nr:hypothetical protein [Ancylobacter oerskovii]